MYEPRTLDEAKMLISTLRTREKRHFKDMCVAKARLYDHLFKDKPEPSQTEFKQKIIHLMDELKHAIRMRDEARARTGEKRSVV